MHCSTFNRIRSATATKRKFYTKFKRQTPSKDTIKKWHLNFTTNGSCIIPRKAPPTTVATPQVAAVITRHFEEDQHDSIRRASLFLNIQTKSVHKVLQKEKNILTSSKFFRSLRKAMELCVRTLLWQSCVYTGALNILRGTKYIKGHKIC